MKRLLVIFALLPSLQWAQLAVPDFPTAPKANPSMTTTQVDYVANSGNCPWIRSHTDLALGSTAYCSGPGNAVFTWYIDALDYITWWYKAVAAYCDSAGVANCNDNVFIHVTRDYYSSAPWSQYSGMFDWAENTSTGNITDNFQAVHGAFRYRSAIFTDVTCGLFGATSGCGTQPNGPIALISGDYLYLGYWQPFDEINFVLTTPASGATLTWEYSTGSGGWSSLAVTDGTSNLHVSGLVTFAAPDDSGTPWKRYIVSGSQSKYWVRLHITGSGVTLTSVRNANASNVPAMLTSSACSDCGAHTANQRGWSQSAWAAGAALTVDGIPYNPTPPSTCPGGSNLCATARFPYQGSYNGYGSRPDRFWPNSDTFNGSVSAAHNILAQELAFKDAIPGVIPSGYTGVIQDNIGAIAGTTATTPAISTLIAQMDLHCGSGCTVAGVQGDEGSGGVYGYTPAFKAANTQILALQSSGFLVNWNNAGPSTMGQTAATYDNEFANRTVYEPNNTPWQAFDDTLASTNTLGSVLYTQFIDPTKYGNLQDPAFSTVWHRFDSDRGVMDAVAEFYLGDAWCQSSRTSCLASTSYDYNYSGYQWDTSASASYYATDEVGVYQTLSTLTSAVGPSPLGTAVVFTVASDALYQPVGGPYYATYGQLRLCPTPTTCNNGDKIAVTHSGTNQFTTVNVAGGSVPPILGTYSIGTTVQFATTSTLHTLSSPPPWSNVGTWWALWQPVIGVDVGKPDYSGYAHGVRGCGPACATTALPSPPPVMSVGSTITCVGHAGFNGCSSNAPASCSHGSTFGDLWRRDFVNAAGQHNIVLVRTYFYGACTDDFDWPSQNIGVSYARGDCAPTCSYQRLHSDGTLDTPASVYNLRAGESAILMQVASVPPPTLTITSGPCPDGTVGVPYNCYLTATGGTLPYTWGISGGSLCSWATLSTVSNVGIISGTPTLNSCSFTEKVTDWTLATKTQPNSITVTAPPAAAPTKLTGTVKVTGSVVVQ